MTTLTLGKRLVPLEQIAFVEPFDPAANTRIKTEKPFRSRGVLLNRESVLAEFDPFDFAKEHGFRLIIEDQLAANPNVAFGVETFTPMEGFTPVKPYRSRLIWRDGEGVPQSKLLVAPPETLLAIAVRGEEPTPTNGDTSPPPPVMKGRRKPTRRRSLPAPA